MGSRRGDRKMQAALATPAVFVPEARVHAASAVLTADLKHSVGSGRGLWSLRASLAHGAPGSLAPHCSGGGPHGSKLGSSVGAPSLVPGPVITLNNKVSLRIAEAGTPSGEFKHSSRTAALSSFLDPLSQVTPLCRREAQSQGRAFNPHLRGNKRGHSPAESKPLRIPQGTVVAWSRGRSPAGMGSPGEWAQSGGEIACGPLTPECPGSTPACGCTQAVTGAGRHRRLKKTPRGVPSDKRKLKWTPERGHRCELRPARVSSSRRWPRGTDCLPGAEAALALQKGPPRLLQSGGGGVPAELAQQGAVSWGLAFSSSTRPACGSSHAPAELLGGLCLLAVAPGGSGP